MWVPSTTPADCGNPHLCLNPSTTSVRPSVLGDVIYLGNKILTMAAHTCFVTKQDEALNTPKRCPIVRQSAFVDKNQSDSLHLLTKTRV